MRIAIDVRSLMEGRHSGVEEYTTGIIRAFSRGFPEHTYVLFYNAWQPITLPPFPGNVEIRSFRYPNKLLNAAHLLLNHPRWDQLVKADCFFVPSLRLLPVAPQTPLVTTVHDLSFERFPEFFSWSRRLWHAGMRPRRLMERSNQLIAVSNATAADLQELYRIPAEKISVIHSGVTSAPGRADPADIARVRAKYRLPVRYILYFGTLEPRKNIPSLIQAFAAVADSFPEDLVIAGERGWLTQTIDAARESLPDPARLHLPGFIDQADKRGLYSGATAFVYPSFYEGFGFPPLEALLAGTPVITSYNSSVPEVVGPWARLIDPYSPAELALVLKETVLAPPIVSAETSALIKEHYNWDITAKLTLAVIEKAVHFASKNV